MNIQTLKTDGFVTVQYPPSLRARVQEAMKSWQDFCALPLEEKRKLSGGNRLRDFGYMYRQDTGPHADNKELFHVLRQRVQKLREKAATVRDPRATAFIDAIDTLIKESQALIRDFAKHIEREYKMPGFAAQVMASKDDWTYRYVHYFGGEILANPHADRGGFTLHLYETHGGGEYLDLSGAWHPWPVSDRQTIIFPSMGLQYESRGRLKALWHQVKANDQSAQNGRYSMVAFIDFFCTHRYDDSRRRLQDFEPGFNYALPEPEFNKLFIPR